MVTWCFVAMELRLRFLRFALRKVLSKPCPDGGVIPRSGEEGERINCMSVRLKRGAGMSPLVVIGQSNGLLSCLGSDGQPHSRFDQPIDIPLVSISSRQIEIRHY